MSDPFLGETRLFSFNFAPRNWAFCAGQTMSVQQNQALFSLLLTTYGGNGVSTFMLPDLRGRVPQSQNSSYATGVGDGVETVTLNVNQLPQHSHVARASATVAALNVPAPTAALATPMNASTPFYAPPANLQPMSAAALGSTGAGLPHDNTQPSLVLNFCIALYGTYPSRS